MENKVDLKILETLSSKICHDLINPISAINNGVELIDDFTDQKSTKFSKEALEMVEFSGNQASKRIQVFRIAYGQMLSSTTKMPFIRVKESLISFFENSRIGLDFDEKIADASITSRVGFNRILVNAILLGFELLQIEGEIKIALSTPQADIEGEIILEITGKHKVISDLVQDCVHVKAAPQDICVQTITPYLLGCYADQFDAKAMIKEIDSSTIQIKICFQ